MITAIVGAFLDAKMQHPRTSVALYAVSADVDGNRISQQIGQRVNLAIADLLASASNALDNSPTRGPSHHPRLMTSVLFGAMTGVSRVLLESPNPAELFPAMREELILLAVAYLAAHTSAPRT